MMILIGMNWIQKVLENIQFDTLYTNSDFFDKRTFDPDAQKFELPCRHHNFLLWAFQDRGFA